MRHPRFVLALAFALGSSAVLCQQPASQRLRVAVMDISGSALKMQQSTTGYGGAPQGMPGVMPGGIQTTSSVAIPAPADFARGLTEMLGSVLISTGRFSVLERAYVNLAQRRASGDASNASYCPC